MAFPVSPTNGQTTTVNGITYVYASTLNSWTRVTANSLVLSGNLTVGNVGGNLIPTANVTYNLGSSTNRWKDLWLSGNTVYIGRESISVSGTGEWAFTSNGATVSMGKDTEFNPPAANIGGTLKASGNIVAASTTTSTSITTGALVVAGGTGIAGALYNGGIHVSSGNIVAASGTGSTSTTTGALVVEGGVGIAGNTYVGTNLGFTGTGARIIGDFNNGTITNRTMFQGTVTNGATVISALPNGTSQSAQVVAINASDPTNAQLAQMLVSATEVSLRSAAYGTGTSSYLPMTLYTGGSERVKIDATAGNLVITTTTASTSTTTGALVVKGGAGFNGNVFTSGWIIPSGNVSQNLGSSTAWWNLVYGKSVQAQYADLAENYKSDTNYVPGTVVVFGGDAEVTITNTDHDPRVAGVISTDPAYLMNAAAAGVPVALTGRVPCMVLGPVEKGDRLVTSKMAGIAQRLIDSRHVPGCIFGKSLERIERSEVKVIEIAVGRD